MNPSRRYHVCFSGDLSCSGCNPCDPCKYWNKQLVLPVAMIQGRFNGDPQQADAFFAGHELGWRRMAQEIINNPKIRNLVHATDLSQIARAPQPQMPPGMPPGMQPAAPPGMSPPDAYPWPPGAPPPGTPPWYPPGAHPQQPGSGLPYPPAEHGPMYSQEVTSPWYPPGAHPQQPGSGLPYPPAEHGPMYGQEVPQQQPLPPQYAPPVPPQVPDAPEPPLVDPFDSTINGAASDVRHAERSPVDRVEVPSRPTDEDRRAASRMTSPDPETALSADDIADAASPNGASISASFGSVMMPGWKPASQRGAPVIQEKENPGDPGGKNGQG